MSVVKFLIQNIDDVNTEDFVGRLRTKISECFTTMDEIDDDMPESFMEFMDGFNALQLSAFCNRIPVDVMRTLLEAGVDVEKTTRAGKTSLMLSTSGRNPPVAREKMKLLLEYSANIDAYDGSFETALHIACYEGNLDGMKMILEERKKRIEYENGRQARQEAAERLKGYIDSDTIGINHWPRGEENGLMRPLYLDPLHLKNSEHETPLTIAMGSCLKPFSTKIKVRNERRKEMMKLLVGF
jgi:ankyrin repeat protein